MLIFRGVQLVLVDDIAGLCGLLTILLVGLVRRPVRTGYVTAVNDSIE